MLIKQNYQLLVHLANLEFGNSWLKLVMGLSLYSMVCKEYLKHKRLIYHLQCNLGSE